LSETGRDLLDAAELRQMAEHTQAVAIIGSAPPVRFGFPRCAKTGPLAHPLPPEIAQPVSLADAETAFANRKTDETEKTQDEPATIKVSPMPDLDGDYVEEDEQVIPQDHILFPLIEERQLGRSQAALSVPLSPVPSDAVLKRINEKERRRELRSRLEIGDKRDLVEGRSGAASDRSHVFNDYTASRLARIEKLTEGLQKSQVETGAGQGSLHPSESGLNVSLSNDKDAPRLPVGDIRVYDAIERMVTGAKFQLSTWIGRDGTALINGFTEKEYYYRVKVAGFLNSYVHERFRDHETRLIHDNEIFSNAHKALNQAETPEELNRAAYDFMSMNESRGRPLGERERWLLFHGRVPDHYTPEMAELRLTWGLPREGREQALRDGRLPPSPALKAMLDELETRRNVESVRQYQKSLMTSPEEMRNPGRLPLYQMHKKLLGHERDYLYHMAEEMKRRLPGKEPPVRRVAKAREEEATGRAFGEVPHESNSYKEYIASIGEIKRRLLEEAASRLTGG
jgi:hypothetical protein